MAITAYLFLTPTVENINDIGGRTATSLMILTWAITIQDGPAPQQFRNPALHCAELSVDRLLYVCDRANDRIQVFKPDGTFVKEAFVAKRTLGSGSAWDIAFSKDPQQKYIYLTDGENDRVHILSRDTLKC